MNSSSQNIGQFTPSLSACRFNTDATDAASTSAARKTPVPGKHHFVAPAPADKSGGRKTAEKWRGAGTDIVPRGNKMDRGKVGSRYFAEAAMYVSLPTYPAGL